MQTTNRPAWSRYFPLLIVACGAAAYLESFAGVFVFDDVPHIVDNPHIRQFPPPLSASGNRPLLFFTLAANFALSGLDVWSYHALNLIVHLLAGLALYGVVRRTLNQPFFQDRYTVSASGLALAVALIWTVHPLQTQSVTYIIQRGEAMAGLFYLVALYCVIRGAGNTGGWPWYLVCMAAFLLGLTSKEVIVSAPLVILLYDRCFLTDSFARSLRQRRMLYLGFAVPALLAILLAPTRILGLFRGDLVSATRWEYAVSQPGVLLHYLRLALWPHPLCLDYARSPATGWMEIGLPGLLVGLLLLGTAWTLYRRLPVGFLGAWFFLILAPTSSLVPLKDLLVEHRMYLPLAALVALVVVGCFHLLQSPRLRMPKFAGPATILLAAIGLIYLTGQRNIRYHSLFSIWSDVVVQHPQNLRGYYNLDAGFYLPEEQFAQVLFCYSGPARLPDHESGAAPFNDGMEQLVRGEYREAIESLSHAIDASPDAVWSRNCLGMALYANDNLEEAIKQFRSALSLEPGYADAHNNLANCLLIRAELDTAIDHYEQALRLQPDLAEAHYNLGCALVDAERLPEARSSFTRSLELKPNLVDARHNLGSVLAILGKWGAALEQYGRVLEHTPESAAAHINAGLVKLRQRRYDAALEQISRALELQPGSLQAHSGMGIALHGLAIPFPGEEDGTRAKMDRAMDHFHRVLELNPKYEKAHNNLANCLLALGEVDAAVDLYRQTLRARPDLAEAHHNLGKGLLLLGRREEAARQFHRAQQLQPEDNSIAVNLQLAQEDERFARD